MAGLPVTRCPCGEPVVLPVEGGIRIRGVAVVAKSQAAFVVCRKCHNEVPVPVRLVSADPEPRLVIPHDA